MKKKLSFETYLDKTSKDKVVKYLRDRITDRVNERMTKDKIYYIIDSFGLKKQIEDDMNMWRGHVDFFKYGL